MGLSSLFAVNVPGVHFIDVVWLLILILYVVAGMTLAPFHGDEAMHLYTSHDYATAFIYRQPGQLPVNPPYDIDSDARLRLLNGSVMRYSVGLSWQLAGLTDNDLPPRPGWDWGLFYDQNVATGHRPSEALLSAGRTVSLIYLALSIVVIFGIGWQFGGRFVAYLASLLYVLNPIILLNGRRALVESALLCFGLLTIWVALQLVRRQEEKRREHTEMLPYGNWQSLFNQWGWWAALILTSALALASKYSGTIFVAGAFGGIFVAAVVRCVISFRLFSVPGTSPPGPLSVYREGEQDQRNLFRGAFASLLINVLKLAVSGGLTLALLVALSPALWNDPLNRARDLAIMLQEQVDIVVSILPDAPTTLQQRVEGILTQPFMAPVAYFEQASWAEAEPIRQEITRYQASPLSGLAPGIIIGLPLTLLAGCGLLASVRPRLRPFQSTALSVVLLMWLLVTIVNLLINPLPWQRYYLPLIPIVTLLAAVGTTTIYHFFRPEPR